MKPSTSTFVLRLALANALLLGALLLVTEGLTRAIGWRYRAIPEPRSDAQLLMYDSRLGWRLRPGSNGTTDHGGPDRGTVHINGLGLRGPELAPSRQKGVRRVLVLGDSFAFGLGVDQRHTFGAQLAELLSATMPTEAVNLGVTGYGTDQELLLFEQLGRRLQPDLVVLVVCDNDFDQNTQDFVYDAYYKPFFQGPALTLEGTPVPRLTTGQATRLWLGRHSNIWNAFRTRASSDARGAALVGLFAVARPRPTTEDPVDLTFRLLERLRERVHEEKAELVLFNTGHRGERLRFYRDLRPRLDASGFLHFSFEGPLEEARAAQPSRYWDFGADFHWNVAAHHLAAEVTRYYIARWRLIGEPSPE